MFANSHDHDEDFDLDKAIAEKAKEFREIAESEGEYFTQEEVEDAIVSQLRDAANNLADAFDELNEG